MTQEFFKGDLKVFFDSIEIYGMDAQIDQMQEEAIELALAIRKLKRAQISKQSYEIEKRKMELISELADVIIMTTQCRLLFNDNLIQEEIRRKMARQEQRIAKYRQES